MAFLQYLPLDFRTSMTGSCRGNRLGYHYIVLSHYSSLLLFHSMSDGIPGSQSIDRFPYLAGI